MKITLKEFLYKFTAVPSKFIDDYFYFYELCENETFGIPVEQIVKYLGITNQLIFEERIRKMLILNTDYVIIRKQQKSKKGVKNANYMISFDGFEKLCFRSTTQKAVEYVDYHTTLRKFIDYYKENFADSIMELTQTSKFMYILGVNKTKDIFKIGRTANIRKRLQAYATGKDKHPDIKFILIVKDDKQVEKCSKMFAKTNQYKGNKELYKANLDKLKKLIVKCAETDKFVAEGLDDSPGINRYIIYDNAKTIEYLNLDGDVIGMAKISKTVKKQSRQKSNKSGSATHKSTD
jgi:phage anti-repressor protein